MIHKKTLIRVAIVGSGTTALGCLRGIEHFLREMPVDKQFNLQITHFLDSRDDLHYYRNTNQINRRLGRYGTSTKWHAVSPCPDGTSVDFMQLFRDFYQEQYALEDANALYIPYYRPKLSRLFAKTKAKLEESPRLHSYNETPHYVKSISKSLSDDSYSIKSDEDFITISDLVFVCTSVIDLRGIEYQNCSFPEYVLVDHDQVHLGVFKSDFDESLLGKVIERTTRGFYVGANLSTDLLMVRPWHSSVSQISLANFQNFGKSTFSIFCEILGSRSIGKIKEAFFTRFGVFQKAKHYSLWVQRRVVRNDISEFMNKDFEVINVEDLLERHKSFLETLPELHVTGFSIPGNHIIGETESDTSKDTLQFLTIANQNWLDGRHHTLLLSQQASDRVFNLFMSY